MFLNREKEKSQNKATEAANTAGAPNKGSHLTTCIIPLPLPLSLWSKESDQVPFYLSFTQHLNLLVVLVVVITTSNDRASLQ